MSDTHLQVHIFIYPEKYNPRSKVSVPKGMHLFNFVENMKMSVF